MFSATNQSAFRDGVFSHASPRQPYQSSVSEYADGGLGATARLLPGPGFRDMRGLGRVFRDGVLGKAFRDGSLGADISLPNISVTSSAPQTELPLYQRPGFVLGAVGATALLVYLLMRK